MSIKRTIITTILALALVAVVAPVGNVGAVTIDELMAQIGQLQAQLLALQGAGATPVPTGNVACVGVTFERNLKVGMTGSDVKCLQVLMNNNGFTIAQTGAGSPGAETSYFGQLTLTAVKAFQVSKGWTPANQVGPMTRAALNALINSGSVIPPVVTPVGGALSVALSANNPAASSVANSSSADFTKFILTAGVNQVNVSRLYVTRTGLSTNNAVSNIKIVDAATGAYAGSIGSLNSNNQALITFTQNLVIPANTSKEFIIRASVGNSTNAPAGNTIALGVNGSDITSNASGVSGYATGNYMTAVNIIVGTVAVAEDGTTVNSSPNVGDTGVTVNQFTVTVGSTEDVTISAITMLKAGTINNSYITNLSLYDVTKGTTLATVPALNAEGKVTWGNLNLVITKGNTERFRIKADIIDGPGTTVNADIVDGSDVLVVARGNTYGFYIAPTATGSWGGQATNNQSVQSGGFTVSKSATTPATGNTSAGTDKTLAVLTFNAAGEAIKVSSLKLTATLGTMTYDEVTNIKVYDENGVIVTGPSDLGSGSTVTFTDTFIVPVGLHNYTIKAKLASSVSTSDTIRIGVATASTDVTATGMTSNSTVAASGSAVYGNYLTVKAGALAVTTNNQPAGRSIAKGTSGVTFGTFTLSAASSGEDVQVTNITVYDSGTGAYDFVDLANVALYQGTTRISQVYNPASASTSQAFPLTTTVTVPAGGSVTIAIVGDLKTGAGNTNHIMQIDGLTGSVTSNGASTGTAITETYSVAGAQTMVVASSGVLTVTADSTTPVADLVLGNTQVTLGIFRLAASNVEDLQINEINLVVTYGGDVSSYAFYNGSALLGTVEGGTAPKLVLGSGALIAPANGNVKVTVKGFLNPVDGTTVGNNQGIIAGIGGTNVVKATGVGSGAEVTTSDAQSAGANTMTIVKAKPTVTLASGSPSGTLYPNTSTKLAVFNVANTNGGDDITFDDGESNLFVVKISRTQTTSDGVAGTWTLVDDDTGTVLSTISVADTASSVTFTFNTNETAIGPGATKKFAVYGDTHEYTTENNSIQVSLDDASNANISYSIASGTTIDAATYVFRNDILGGNLIR